MGILYNLRNQYSKASLEEADLAINPIEQFDIWFYEIQQAGSSIEPNAMTLSTVGSNMQPSARIVLLKSFSPQGFTFFTNYESRKAQQITENPKAALLFFWHPLERQVRIEGIIEKLPASESNTYFASRPRESQIGAWASAQSQGIENRKVLDERYKNFENEFTADVPRPENWGGYILTPNYFEFWQGRVNRLHDRIEYQKLNDESWSIRRLAP